MASLRPGLSTLSRSLITSHATSSIATGSSSSSSSRLATRFFSTTPLGQKPSSVLSAPRLSPLKASQIINNSSNSSNILLRPPFQTRGARINPFQRSNNSPSQTGHNATGQVNSSGSSAEGFSLGALPHEAPSGDGPRSFSAPGGWQRALTSLGMIGGTALAAHLFFNRETRDGAMDAYSQSYLNSTFQYLAGGLTMVTAASVGLHRVGFSSRLMATNPWLVLGVGLAASIGGMIGAQSLPPGSPGKYACWALFNVSQAAVLSPLLFLSPALLARAGLYTAGVVGSICYIGATAKDGKYLWLGGPLLAGVTLVALSSLAPMILPVTAFRTLVATEAISLYGGLAVFSGFTLWDTQKVLHHAKLAQQGAIRPDPLRESIGLELDFINIFIRITQILAMQQNRKK